jgi:hypothetical protein
VDVGRFDGWAPPLPAVETSSAASLIEMTAQLTNYAAGAVDKS